MSKPRSRRVARWALWSCAWLGAAVAANELSGKPVPFLRWSVLRLLLGGKHLSEHWQAGDGREDALADHVVTHARRGDVAADYSSTRPVAPWTVIR